MNHEDGNCESAWLLDPAIDGCERARRYVRWYLNQLNLEHEHIERGRANPTSDGPAHAEAAAANAQSESDMLATIGRAAWNAEPAKSGKKGGRVAPALLRPDGSREAPESRSVLVERLLQNPDAYRLLSHSGHGEFSGIVGSLRQVGVERKGRVLVGVGGTMVPPGLALISVCEAIRRSARQLIAWNGVSTDKLDTALRRLARFGLASVGWQPSMPG